MPRLTALSSCRAKTDERERPPSGRYRVLRARAKIAQGKLDQFTRMPSDASSERTYRKLKEDWREATEHAEHLRRRLGRFQWREAAE